MKLIIAGSSGLVGKALSRRAVSQGHEVIRLVRNADSGADARTWDPETELIDPFLLEEADLLVNLCGAGIADARWTTARKLELWNSRLHSTRTLVKALGQVRHPPGLFINASAVGYYGNRGDELLTEQSRPGEGFLSDLCQAWEHEACEAEDLGLRTLRLRLGLVLSGQGGFLTRLRPLFSLGLGGPLGNGKAWMSWISLDDLIDLILSAPRMSRLPGVLNAVAPQCVQNRDFCQQLAAELHRPCLLPVPTPLLRLAFGDMADQALLASTRASPTALLGLNFPFRYPELRQALRQALTATTPHG